MNRKYKSRGTEEIKLKSYNGAIYCCNPAFALLTALVHNIHKFYQRDYERKKMVIP